jgi:lipopolysaccharide transport system ATP-binding protein
MSDIVLSVEGLYKRYRLGMVDRQAFKEDLVSFWANLTGKPDPYESYITSNELAKVTDASQIKSRYVWSLQDINFEVKRGEILGVIGKNGAGKSTLLKILSKTTSPTRGQIKIKGKIASLLEVGTGFHPELTGRENIFMNGSILGMRKYEIQRKLDEIIAFAGVEAYIDTPVKRYSSGMYVRLAFAVAAHLEPDILIVDEVLAVGDAEFQKKCIGKMKDVSSGEGRAVLFVSHNMAAVQNLCTNAIVLENGKLLFEAASVENAIIKYNESTTTKALQSIKNRVDRAGSGYLRVTSIKFLNSNDNEIESFITGQFLKIRIYYQVYKKLTNVLVAIGLNSWSGENKTIFSTDLLNLNYNSVHSDGFFECTVDKFPLSMGNYLVNIFIQNDEGIIDWIQEATVINVENGDFFGTGKAITTTHQSVLVKHNWTI